MSKIYLDYASATPLDKKVYKAMKPYWARMFKNPSSIYEGGLNAKNAIEEARKSVARIVNCRASDIYFTGSGTESINLAIRGVVNFYKKTNKVGHVITSLIEHPAVLETVRRLESDGVIEVTYLKVDEEGMISLQELESNLKENTILVTLMYANNEIGTINQIKEIGRRIKLWKTKKNKEESDYPFFHTDASQAPNYLSIDREKLNVDMMTLDGSKIYGPKGVGVLYKRSHINLDPIITGGGQESSLRSGTENTPLIVGFAKAIEIAQSKKEKESARLCKLQEYFFTEIKKVVPETIINGSTEESRRLPNNINFCIPGIDAEFTVIQFDNAGIELAYVSACSNLNEESESYVVKALQKDNCSKSSIRISMGRDTKKSHLKKVLKLLPKFVKIQSFDK